MEERPPKLLDEHLDYLDKFRLLGPTKMCGAAPWLRRAYPYLSEKDSRDILSYWVATFGLPR